MAEPELTVPYFGVAAALGRALDHDSPEFWEVIAELEKAFPNLGWHNAMTDSTAEAPSEDVLPMGDWSLHPITDCPPTNWPTRDDILRIVKEKLQAARSAMEIGKDTRNAFGDGRLDALEDLARLLGVSDAPAEVPEQRLVVIAPTYQRARDLCRERGIDPRRQIIVFDLRSAHLLRGVTVGSGMELVFLGYPDDPEVAGLIREDLIQGGWDRR